MSQTLLPNKVNPYRFAENAVTLQGYLPLKNMERLLPSLLNDKGIVTIEMMFGVDEQGIHYIKGHLSSALNFKCQRCMKPFVYEIIDDFIFGLAGSEEEAERIPEFYDPLVISENELLIQDMVEEELIVSLPIVPMHPELDCAVKLPLSIGETGTAGKDEKDNPFKVIEFLRSKPKQ